MAAYVDQRKVKTDEADVRLDRWFQRHFPQLSHGQLAKLLRTGQVRVDGKRAEGKTRLQAGQIIRIPPLPKASPDAKQKPPAKISAKEASRKIAEHILYEDDDVVLINKPAGLAVQGGTGIKESLDDWLSALAHQGERPKLVHRLDKETSGVLVLARNTFAATKLTAAFRSRDVTKIYVALAHGKLPAKQAEINAPLLKQGQRMVVDKSGDVAISTYKVLGYSKQHDLSAVQLTPYTGRTHQLRVHAAHVGRPLVGDPLYGNKEADKALGIKGLHLHSVFVSVPHPRNATARIDVLAPLPMLQQKTWDLCGLAVPEKFEAEDV